MEQRRTKIELALEDIVRQQRAKDFEDLAFQLARENWSDLQPTEFNRDGGEDGITVPSACSDGKRRSLASSLTGTLGKVKADCKRIAGRSVEIDELLFYTPVPVDNVARSRWKEEIRREFKHGLEVFPRASIVGDLVVPGKEWMCREYLRISLSNEPDLDAIENDLRKVAAERIYTWKRLFEHDSQTHIPLTFQAAPLGERQLLTLEELFALIRRARRLTLKGVPGAGKTITLLQIADRQIAAPDTAIPLLVSLRDWASTNTDLLSYLEAEVQFKALGITRSDLARLNQSGRLMFLLNGWNEISQGALVNAVPSLRNMIAGSPATAFVLTTRESSVFPFLEGSEVSVAPLDFAQRRAIIACHKGIPQVESVRHEIENETALDQITRIPLFLSGVLRIAGKGELIPRSHYGILLALIRQTESHPDHQAEIRQGHCHGNHRAYLSSIARQMCGKGATALSEREASEAIGQESNLLKRRGIIGKIPDAPSVLDTLISHHLLVRSPGPGGDTVSFVHQQFQEWFAAEWLYEQLSRVAEQKDAEGRSRFQQDFSNNPSWEESLRFLAERLREEREHDPSSHLAKELVSLTIPVDLIFAAELADLVGWDSLGEVWVTLGGNLRKWYAMEERSHKEGALAAMLATGSPEFLDILVPLFENPNDQIRFWVYRLWEPFPLSCLGPDWRSRYLQWPEERRKEFVYDIAHSGSISCRRLAELVQDDESALVHRAAQEIFDWYGAYEILVEYVERTPDQEWPSKVNFRVFQGIDPIHVSPLLSRFKAILPQVSDPRERYFILSLLAKAEDPEALSLMQEEVVNRGGENVLLILPMIYTKDPKWVSRWLADRMLEGLFWDAVWAPGSQYVPFWREEWAECLAGVSKKMKRSLAEFAFQEEEDLRIAQKRIQVFSKIDPDLSARLLLREYVAILGERLRTGRIKGNWEREDVLRSVMRDMPYRCLARAILEDTGSAVDSVTVSILLEVLSPGFGGLEKDLRTMLSSEDLEQVRALILRWDQTVQPAEDDEGGRRAKQALVLGAVGRPEDAARLMQWIKDDEERRGKTGSRTHNRPAYCQALASLDCLEATDNLLDLLSFPEYLYPASDKLLNIVESGEGTIGRRAIPSWPEYEKFLERRQAWPLLREKMSKDSQVVRFRNAIHKAIASALDGKVYPGLFHWAVSALAQLGDEECVPLLLQCRSPEALEILAFKGATLPGEATLQVLGPIIAEIEENPWDRGKRWWEAIRWLSLLLFTDKPALGLENISSRAKYVFSHWESQHLLKALSSCGASEAYDFLADLYENPDVAGRWLHEYILALGEAGNMRCRDSLLRILDDFLDGKIPLSNDRSRTDIRRTLSAAFVKLAQRDATIISETANRCRRMLLSPEQKDALICILEEQDLESRILPACDLLDDEEKNSWERLRHLTEDSCVYHEKAESRDSYYYVRPRSCTTLRSHLMHLAQQDPARRRSALALLSHIESLRIKYGRPIEELRHPDFSAMDETGTPWPLLQN